MPDAVAIPKLISAKTVAAETGLSIWRLYELAREGRIPHRRLGRSVMFTREALAAQLIAQLVAQLMAQGPAAVAVAVARS
jgi:excisionase family DNA binding protein